jgi:hypothetical protein
MSLQLQVNIIVLLQYPTVSRKQSACCVSCTARSVPWPIMCFVLKSYDAPYGGGRQEGEGGLLLLHKFGCGASDTN